MHTIRKLAMLALASGALAVVPAVAEAHPQIPVSAGKQAIRHYAVTVGNRLNDGWFVGVSGCRHTSRTNVGCTVEFDFDTGVACTEPLIAYYPSSWSNRISIFYDNKLVDCQ